MKIILIICVINVTNGNWDSCRALDNIWCFENTHNNTNNVIALSRSSNGTYFYYYNYVGSKPSNFTFRQKHKWKARYMYNFFEILFLTKNNIEKEGIYEKIYERTWNWTNYY